MHQGKTLTTAALLQSGPPIDPLTRVILYDDKEWEKFIDEWVSGSLKSQYVDVQRMSGANDKGIDIAAFGDDQALLGVWDNYQCKHYAHPLRPSDVWPEFGKILWYSFNKVYVAPRRYYFVAPRNSGTTLAQLLLNKVALKDAVIANWDKNIRTAITKYGPVELTDEFADYVTQFDFGIFRPASIRSIIEQHRLSSYFIMRFGGGLPARPAPDLPPDQPDQHESRYVAQLLAAYGDHVGEPVADLDALKKWEPLSKHLRRQREAFYHAESLRVFVRDKVEPGTFESLQEEIYSAVADTHDANHPDGYQRVVAVMKVAQDLPLTAHALSLSTFTKDKHGICHQLANEDRVQWVKVKKP